MNKRKQAIAADLKKLGYNSRSVSIKERSGSYDRSFIITIRDPDVDFSAVADIKSQHTSIDWDAASGEILSGGNVFIDVKLSDQVADIWASKYLPAVQAAIALLKDNDCGVDIDERFVIFKDGSHFFKIWDNTAIWLSMRYSEPRSISIDLYKLQPRGNKTVAKVMEGGD